MKFGVREICDVVFRAKNTMTVGTKKFYKHEPVIYFDSLKTSTLEGAVTTVYAQGGKGNARLVAWDGEKTVTFTMEDALISPLGMQILAGAGLIEAGTSKAINVHTTYQGKFTTGEDGKSITMKVPGQPYVDTTKTNEYFIYLMPVDSKGEVFTEPYCVGITVSSTSEKINNKDYYTITLSDGNGANDLTKFADAEAILADYYVAQTSNTTQINITPNSLGGNFYVEASTLFRNQDGVDMPAEFIIPNAKVQSNFTFTMASSGDPSTFTFTMDAFPDYTRFDIAGEEREKVFAAIQVITSASSAVNDVRTGTDHTKTATSAN